MPEANVNTEIASHLREHGHKGPGPADDDRSAGRRVEILEILEAVLLALVAIATAWSGYQAALWDTESAKGYATSSRLRVESNQAFLASNQTLAYNAGNVNSWLQAETSGNKELAAILSDRFTPEFKTAFDAWLKTDPLNNPEAPVGPGQMPQFHDPTAVKAEKLSEEASVAFEEGVASREHGDKYVRITVVLAMVLFLIAVGQRFSIRGVRIAVTVVAGVFLVYAAVLVAQLPRA
jgi:hypothetical protein